ncbi:hypothetical protein QWA68_015674 [Fusarium oxysporum]|nr:hypothetical protein QWA68_015674 [Fusarium oxysporum]
MGMSLTSKLISRKVLLIIIILSYNIGTIAGILAMPYWQRLFSTGYTDANGNPNITISQESAIISILSAGTFFGALSSPFITDHISHRPGLIIATWVFNLGVALQTAATAIPIFMAGQFFAGFGVNQISAIIPLYQSETAPKWIRGAIIGAYQWAIIIGLLLAAITPRFLIKKNKPEKAAYALARIRWLTPDHPIIHAELAEVKSKIFFIWFACCFLCIAFVYFFIYETKGLSLEEVDQLYDEVSAARKSTKWRPTESWEHRQSVSGPGGKMFGNNQGRVSHNEKNEV